jgi:Ca2+-binding EF-hand superfamily protein
MKLTATLAVAALFAGAGAVHAAPASKASKAAAKAAKAAAKAAKASTVAFNRADKDDDDQLSLTEFEALLKPLVKERGAKGNKGQNAQLKADLELTASTLFTWFDVDANTFISLDEWLSGRTSDSTVSAPDFTLIPFEVVDRNGNGKANFGEFQNIVSGYVPTGLAKAWFELFLAAQVPVTPVTPTTTDTSTSTSTDTSTTSGT